MPPRGPLNLTLSQGERLAALLAAAVESDEPRWVSVREKLMMGLSAAPVAGAELTVTLVLKEDDADGMLDLLDPDDDIRPLLQTVLHTMRQP
jgi:hypothetical protein